MDPEKIGKFICELRKEKNLSQYQLADMIPISRQGVSKWERGVTTPDTPTLIILSELFDVSIDELLRGERRETHTIEDLEETTLSILEQSNKKTKKIKRISLISTIIITILLLAFLSYYFINSYNSIEVYTIGGNSKNFITRTGIFLTTKEKYYIKLGNIKNKINAEIKSIELYYKIGNKKKIIVKDNNIDDITIEDYYGYSEKISKTEINNIKNNLYLEITYNDNEKEVMKLRYRRDYKNSSLFFLNQKNVGEKKPTKDDNKIEEKNNIEEKKEEEVKPTIQETETKKEETKQTPTPPKEENKPQEQQPTEPEITNEQIINKIKENGTLEDGTYTWGTSDYTIMIMYYESMNKIEYYKDYSLIGKYNIENDFMVCVINNCENEIDDIIKNYLFS